MLHLLIAHVAIHRENEAMPFSMPRTSLMLVTYRAPSSLIGDIYERRNIPFAQWFDLSVQPIIGCVAPDRRYVISTEL